MKKTSFVAEIAKTAVTVCKVCKKNVPKGVIRLKVHVYDHNEYFHFECYQPKLQQYISKADLEIKLDEEKSKALDNWLENWNKNFIPLDKPYHEPPKSTKLVDSGPSKYRRAWVEIFKFIEVSHVAKVLCYVSREFYHITWDNELWHYYCTRDYHNDGLDQACKNYKNQYMLLFIECCYGCHARQDIQGFDRCPMLGRPLCKACRTSKRFTAVSKKDIQIQYNVNPNILPLKFGQGYSNKRVTYRFMVINALKVFRDKNKEDLLKEMKLRNVDPDLVEFTESIDTNKMDRMGKFWKNYEKYNNLLDPLYELIYEYIRTKEGEKRFKKKLYESCQQVSNQEQ